MLTHQRIFEELLKHKTFDIDHIEAGDDDNVIEGGVEEKVVLKKYIFTVPDQLRYMPKVPFPTSLKLIQNILLNEYRGDILEAANNFLSSWYTEIFIGNIQDCLHKEGIVGLIIPVTETKNFKFYKCKYIPFASVSRDNIVIYLLIEDKELVEYDIKLVKEIAFFDTTTYE